MCRCPVNQPHVDREVFSWTSRGGGLVHHHFHPHGHLLHLFHPLRFETLEPEMNALAARITAVNDIAEQLLKAKPPGKDSIVTTQKQLNHRWAWRGAKKGGSRQGWQPWGSPRGHCTETRNEEGRPCGIRCGVEVGNEERNEKG